MAGPVRTLRTYSAEIVRIYQEGDAYTRLSFAVMGLGCIRRRQYLKGLLYLAFEVLFFVFQNRFGSVYLSKFATLGVNAQQKVWDEAKQIYLRIPGDNSMLILLFGVLSIAAVFAFLVVWRMNLRSAFHVQRASQNGKHVNNALEDIKTLLNERFHITLLSLPMLSLALFTVLPTLFMILIAFTNFDKNHQPPGNLFTWVGLANIGDVFWDNAIKSHTFFSILGWTIAWAVLATFTNYILGMLLAILINQKGVRLKQMWRTIFVIAIAIPQFVSLLLISRMLEPMGIVNIILQRLNITSEPIPFLTNPAWARLVVVAVNMWIGIPYTMLSFSGILMNIPADLYESAAIDGAGPVRRFLNITLPYMVFVTAPATITTFVTNFNNFNVIYLLTAGGPWTLEYYQGGKTDLLVTWLYKLTVDQQDFALASTIGIFIFMIVSVLSLSVYNLTGSVRREDEFK